MNQINIFNNKKLFLAGATGSVGSAILELILKNYPLTKVKASYNSTAPFLKDIRVEYVKADLRSKNGCRDAVSGCDMAIMAASNSAGAKLMTAEPWKFLNDNLIMNAEMFEAFHYENVRRVIYIGTAAVYQPFEGYIREDGLDLNIDPHPAYMGVAWVARFLEKLCKFWNEQTGMEIIVVRAANIFGPYASFNPSRSYFIPALIRKAINKMDPFEVWGTGDVTRDVLYSEDFSEAILKMLERDELKFEIFNLGSGSKTTVADVVKYALKSAKHEPREIKYIAGEPTTIKFRAVDITKAKNLLAWEPRHTSEEGIKRTVEWWQENRTKWGK